MGNMQEIASDVALELVSVDCPRVMIAAPHGRSGKTLLTLGLIRALSRTGVVVRPFKKGPDYIDTGWHGLAAKRASRNLDCYFMSDAQIIETLAAAPDASNSLCVIEAAMGLFDGQDVEGSSSSARIAHLSSTPVILVIDVTRMTRTAAAVVMGMCAFDKNITIAAVILNKVRGTRQHNVVSEAIERYCNIAVIGSIRCDERMIVPDRHLGLVSSTERDRQQDIDAIADIVASQVDLNAVQAIAHRAPALEVAPRAPRQRCTGIFEQIPPTTKDLLSHDHAAAIAGSAPVVADSVAKGARANRARPLAATYRAPIVNTVASSKKDSKSESDAAYLPTIVVIRDRAFSFYYQENFDALKREGSHLVFANSLSDQALPKRCDALYIGGGFPEIFAKDIQENASFKLSVLQHIEQGLPVFAECGGLIYLGRRLFFEGKSYNMVGALGYDTRLGSRQVGHGYACTVVDNPGTWLGMGCILKGHEHHHSQVVNLDTHLVLACHNRRGRGIVDRRDAFCYKAVIAQYLHVNAFASPLWAARFVRAAYRYHQSAQLPLFAGRKASYKGGDALSEGDQLAGKPCVSCTKKGIVALY